VSACALVAGVALAAACGFDGIGSKDPATPAGSDGGKDPDGTVTIQLDPDAAMKPGCAWPALQAGAPWVMLGGCVTHAGRSAFRGPHKEPVEIWKAAVKTNHPVPSIGADDTVYVPADTDGIRAFSPDGGSRLIDLGGGAVTNTPAIGADGTLHAGAQNFVVAQRPDGGRTRYDMTAKVETSALLDADGNVYMSSSANKLVSLDPAGNRRWELATGSDVKGSAAIGPNGDIYVGSNSHKLYAVGKDGTKRWEYDAGANLESSPVIADDGTIYVGAKDSKLHAVLPNGTKKWVFDGPGAFDWQVLPALGADGTIYAPSGSKLVALRPDGTTLWTFDIGSAIRAPVVVDLDGIVYVGADASRVLAITPAGNQLWAMAIGNVPYGFAIGRDGTLFVTCDGDKIHALRE
jgi:hypothetical protein